MPERKLMDGLGFSVLVRMGLQTPCVCISNDIAFMVQSTASVLLHSSPAVLRPAAPLLTDLGAGVEDGGGSEE